jgi:transposase-like protein
MPRMTYSSKQKVAMVRTMEEHMAHDRSLTRRAIARDLAVDSSQIRKWQQQRCTKTKLLAKNFCSQYFISDDLVPSGIPVLMPPQEQANIEYSYPYGEKCYTVDRVEETSFV